MRFSHKYGCKDREKKTGKRINVKWEKADGRCMEKMEET
jgi:hypothetical protein